MGATDRFSTRKGDAFEVMSALAEEGETFDVVICDPPAFAPNKQVLEKGLRAYERVARFAAPSSRRAGILAFVPVHTRRRWTSSVPLASRVSAGPDATGR